MASTNLEVEQKFVLKTPDAVRERLQKAGWVEESCIDMVDWYFDVILDEEQTYYPLIRQDCWLRYRSKQPNEGAWELKKGTQSGTKKSSRATVYEELEGEQALLKVQQLVNAFESVAVPSSLTTSAHPIHDAFAEHDIPQPPMAIAGLVPLARLGTQRSSWKHSKENGMVVDLDMTDFGHAVGEVELVCDTSTDVEAAQARLKAWIESVLDQTTVGPPPMGKLEYYISTKRPDVYQVLVEEGLLPDR